MEFDQSVTSSFYSSGSFSDFIGSVSTSGTIDCLGTTTKISGNCYIDNLTNSFTGSVYAESSSGGRLDNVVITIKLDLRDVLTYNVFNFSGSLV